jgi:PAS domain S-box-containing protein
MAARMHAADFSATSLGPMTRWPVRMHCAVELCLASAAPTLVCWGADLIVFYNDEAIALLGDEHPHLLGRSLDDASSCFWRATAHEVRQVQLHRRATTWVTEDPSKPRGRKKTGLAFTCTLLGDADEDERAMLLVVSAPGSRTRIDHRVRDSEQRLRLALQVGRLAIFDLDVRTQTFTWTDELYRMLGYDPGEVQPSYAALAARIHPDDLPILEAAAEAARSEHRLYSHDYRLVLPDGELRWCSVQGQHFYDESDTPVRLIGVMQDTTQRHRFEETQQVLIAELQHRTRNLMGVVSAMADKTVRASSDLADFRTRFAERLDALARVQGLLSRLEDDDRVTFGELIRTELLAVDGGAERATLCGPSGVRLRSSTLQTLALAIHELATNAVKYGALGQPDGRLAVTWRLEFPDDSGQPWLHIDWRESGVAMPRPGAPPSGTGQGRELIERALPYQLKAKTSYSMRPDGVHCTIALPVSATTPVPERMDA